MGMTEQQRLILAELHELDREAALDNARQSEASEPEDNDHFDILALLTPEQRSRIDPDSARRCSDPPVASLLDCCPLGQALGPPPYVLSGYPSPETVAQILEPYRWLDRQAIEDAASRFITWWDGADDATLVNNREALTSAIHERTL